MKEIYFLIDGLIPANLNAWIGVCIEDYLKGDRLKYDAKIEKG